MENIDLTQKQIERLKEETKNFSANATDGEGYCPKYPQSRNGFYYLIITYRQLSESHIKTFAKIARRTRTTYCINVVDDKLQLSFYASYDKFPKTLQ